MIGVASRGPIYPTIPHMGSSESFNVSLRRAFIATKQSPPNFETAMPPHLHSPALAPGASVQAGASVGARNTCTALRLVQCRCDGLYAIPCFFVRAIALAALL